MVVAQLAERFLPLPEVHVSYPAIGQLLKWTYLLLTAWKRRRKRKERPGTAPFIKNSKSVELVFSSLFPKPIKSNRFPSTSTSSSSIFLLAVITTKKTIVGSRCHSLFCHILCSLETRLTWSQCPKQILEEHWYVMLKMTTFIGLKLVSWLSTSNKSALFQRSVVTLI